MQGRINQLTHSQVVDLETSIKNFRTKLGLEEGSETYHYTSLGERKETDDFVKSGVPMRGTKAHSSHFHLKMRVPVQFLHDKMPVYGLLNLAHMQEAVEPVKYNFTRETHPWAEVREQIMADAAPG